MANPANKKRTDQAVRVIQASPEVIYRAFLDPKAVPKWRPPKGMVCRIYAFNPEQGGNFRMSFGYVEENHEVQGKTSEHEDIFHGHFETLVPDRLIVESVEFESDDPAFGGTMTIKTSLVPLQEGTEVTIICKNVPDGIKQEDHFAGMYSTLDNLAEFVKQKR